MLYSSSKQALRNQMRGIHAEIQCNDDADLAMSNVLERCMRKYTWPRSHAGLHNIGRIQSFRPRCSLVHNLPAGEGHRPLGTECTNSDCSHIPEVWHQPRSPSFVHKTALITRLWRCVHSCFLQNMELTEMVVKLMQGGAVVVTFVILHPSLWYPVVTHAAAIVLIGSLTFDINLYYKGWKPGVHGMHCSTLYWSSLKNHFMVVSNRTIVCN